MTRFQAEQRLVAPIGDVSPSPTPLLVMVLYVGAALVGDHQRPIVMHGGNLRTTRPRHPQPEG